MTCNCCILAMEPESETTKEDLVAAFRKIENLEMEKQIGPDFEEFYEDQVELEISSGTIEVEYYCSKLEATEWELSNGMRVCYKNTDIAPGSVRLVGFTYGGSSEVPEDKYFSCLMAPKIITLLGGTSSFHSDEIEFSLNIDSYIRSFMVKVSSSGIEEALLQIYVLFTQKVKATEEKLKAVMELLETDQDAFTYFNNYVKKLNGGESYFMKSVNAEELQKVDPNIACDFFNSCYLDPSSFVVVLVGDFDASVARPLIEEFLGGIPMPAGPVIRIQRDNLTPIPFNFPPAPVSYLWDDVYFSLELREFDVGATGARISGRSSSAPLEYAAKVTEGERKRKGKGAFEAAVYQPSQKKTKGGVPESVDDGPSVLVDNEEALKRASGLLCEAVVCTRYLAIKSHSVEFQLVRLGSVSEELVTEGDKLIEEARQACVGRNRALDGRNVAIATSQNLEEQLAIRESQCKILLGDVYKLKSAAETAPVQTLLGPDHADPSALPVEAGSSTQLREIESSEQLKKFMSDLPSLDDVGQVLMDVGQSLADAEGKKVDLVEVK
ncbi:hypothetical protein C3L33_09118, partial [Rhododendron williamsianum]